MLSLWKKRLFISAILGCVVLASACTSNIAPVEQVQQVLNTQNNNKQQVQPKTQHSKATMQEQVEYLCKSDKIVRIQQPKITKATPKTNQIVVHFEGVSHKLSPAVAESGKKYSNIRWVWWERPNGAVLQNNANKFLAEECMKQ